MSFRKFVVPLCEVCFARGFYITVWRTAAWCGTTITSPSFGVQPVPAIDDMMWALNEILCCSSSPRQGIGSAARGSFPYLS